MRKFRRGLIFFAASFIFAVNGQNSFANHESGQVAKEDWAARYNGPGNFWDSGRALAIDSQGNVYVTGESDGNGTGYDYATLKYDTNGNQLWEKRYNGPGNGYDSAGAIVIDSQDNIYVTGGSDENGTGRDYATIKYDSEGNEQWVVRYNGPGNSIDSASAIALDSQGNVYVTGESMGDGTDFDYAAIKYDTDGNQLWEKRYNGPANGSDSALGLAVDSQDNVYVTGDSAGNETDSDYATIKYDSTGNEQWVVRYNGPWNSYDSAHALAINSQGDVYVTGESMGNGTYHDYATLKYDTDGNPLWEKRYNGPGNGYDSALALAIDSQDNAYVTGYSVGDGTFYDYATLKYDSNGNLLWEKRYNGPGNGYDSALGLAIDSQDNAYVTGYSVGDGTATDYATLKYDTNGNPLWEKRYNGPGNAPDEPHALAIDSQGNVYVTGYSSANRTYRDYATIKYLQLPTVAVDLEPITPHVYPGGKGRYQLTLTNNSDATQVVDYWAREKLPDGEWRLNDAVSPTSVILEPNEIKTQMVRHDVPIHSPLGEYEYWGYVGEDVDHIWDEDMSPFDVTPRKIFDVTLQEGAR